MRQSAVLPVVVLGFLAFGCGSVDSDDSLGSNSSGITNGIVLQETDAPSVVLLYRRVIVNGQLQGASTCTGTWITPRKVLTAAHCTGDGPSDGEGKVQDLQMAIIEITDHTAKPKTTRAVAWVTQAIRNKLWEKKRGSNEYDLAILEMSDPQPGAPARVPVRMSEATAKRGDSISIVGYGFNNMSTFGRSGDDHKRLGRNTVAKVANGFLTIQGTTGPGIGDGTNASAGNGDSGGPMFLGEALVGVASSGGSSGLLRSAEADYVDLHSANSKAFLSKFDLSW